MPYESMYDKAVGKDQVLSGVGPRVGAGESTSNTKWMVELKLDAEVFASQSATVPTFTNCESFYWEILKETDQDTTSSLASSSKILSSGITFYVKSHPSAANIIKGLANGTKVTSFALKRLQNTGGTINQVLAEIVSDEGFVTRVKWIDDMLEITVRLSKFTITNNAFDETGASQGAKGTVTVNLTENSVS